MLAVSSLRETTTSKDEIHIQVDDSGNEEFLDFSDENLLESIDFNDLFAGINDGEKLPDLEIYPELLAEFSVSGTSSEGSEKNMCDFNGRAGDENPRNESNRVSGLGSKDETNWVGGGGGDNISKHEESAVVNCQQPKDCEKGKKSSGACVKSNNQGKKKMKVDWTPDLHRRFVQAVEQLGVDKAVPSRILEVMGTDCLTRHNIASHLQKYRSHKKHLLVREAASWSQRRQTYGAGDGSSKRIMAHWATPTMGFPPMPNVHHHFRPLHVWGHPRMDTKPLMLMWPKHLSHSPPPLPPTWATPTPILPSDPNSYWNHHHQLVPNGLTPGTPCYPQPLAPTTRFATPPVPGIPPHAIGLTAGQSGPHHLLDFHPSKESIDAAIGDALSKPWQPLPIGLKPPSTDGVLVELQRQGIAKVPPSCA